MLSNTLQPKKQKSKSRSPLKNNQMYGEDGEGRLTSDVIE